MCIRDRYPAATALYPDGHPHESTMNPFVIAPNSEYEFFADRVDEGMYLERNLIKGDIGLFNRAPSLHRQSIMAFRIVPVLTKSLRMNPTVCIPFNADYDGDAMKLHFVRSEKARKAVSYTHLTLPTILLV